MTLRKILLGMIVWVNTSLCAGPHNQLYVGPEIYHVHRTKEGGTSQNGVLYGVRAGYDRIKSYGFYWGGDVLYATGDLKGKSGLGNRLKSDFTDKTIEGRLGYTFKRNWCYKILFTPYVGYGYQEELNHFKRPSPIPVHFKTYFDYVPFGFLSDVRFTDCFHAGINFKVKYMWDPKCKVSHDPDIDSFTQLIKEKFHYRVELPLTYRSEYLCGRFWISLVPFYEYRQYGEHANFPIDFFNTKLRLAGATLKFMYCF